MANRFLYYIYDMAKDIGKSFFRLYIYDMAKLIGKMLQKNYIYMIWQKDVANLLKIIQTIIDNYRCKIE